MDFNAGIFDILIERGTGRPRRPDEPRVRTTLAKQLALYVVLLLAAPNGGGPARKLRAQPAFQFIRDVAVDWDTTRVIAGKIGDYVVVARRERNGPSWYLGAITDEEGADVRRLSFLPHPGAASTWPRSTRTGPARIGSRTVAGHHLPAYGGRHVPAAHRARSRGRASDPESGRRDSPNHDAQRPRAALRLGTPDNPPPDPLRLRHRDRPSASPSP